MLSQMGSTFSYDNEYHGPHQSLIMTPLTERAILSLNVAMRSYQCGTLIGPPGTGKSETIKELARVCGSLIVSVEAVQVLVLGVGASGTENPAGEAYSGQL